MYLWFYFCVYKKKVLTHEQHELASRNEYDFDHPDAFDFELIYQTLKELKKGKQVHIPIYNFTHHARESRQKTIYGANVVIFEGLHLVFFVNT